MSAASSVRLRPFTPLTRAPPRKFGQLPTKATRHEHSRAREREREQQKPEVMRLLTLGALLCGPGLPVRLFFDMDGVLISSRFFLVNIFRVPFPSIPTSLNLTYRPPTHPRTRHLCAPPLTLGGCCAASGPSLSHGSCLSVFLLPLSHIEPRRLTDTQAHGSPQTARAHAAASAQFPRWGRRRKRKRKREAAPICAWLKV